jgi:BA14K-like protein
MIKGLLIMALVCASFGLGVLSAGAQPRHDGGDRGGGGDRGNVTINKYYGGRGGYGGGGPRYGNYYHRQPSFNPSAAIGGAVGGWLYRQWAQPAEPVRDVAWCMNRYRSYDPYTRTYLGYDGLRHGCP